MNNQDLLFFNYALDVAKEALPLDEVPVGCVVVQNNLVIYKAHNLTNRLKNPLAHAEYLCVQYLIDNNLSLNDLKFYITLEPCAMCVGVLERINASVVYGYPNEIFGAKKILNIDIGTCLYNEESIEILKKFYETPNKNTIKSN